MNNTQEKFILNISKNLRYDVYLFLPHGYLYVISEISELQAKSWPILKILMIDLINHQTTWRYIYDTSTQFGTLNREVSIFK